VDEREGLSFVRLSASSMRDVARWRVPAVFRHWFFREITGGRTDHEKIGEKKAGKQEIMRGRAPCQRR